MRLWWVAQRLERGPVQSRVGANDNEAIVSVCNVYERDNITAFGERSLLFARFLHLPLKFEG